MTDSSELAETSEFPLSELMERFREEWSQRRQTAGEPVTRIASFNLLIVSLDGSDRELDEVVESLAASHPSRVIWTKLCPDKTWEQSTAKLHLGCRCDSPQVCSEQVQLICGKEYERIPSMVMPLIHSGLPTHLIWWKAGPLKSQLFERLSDRARLILWEPDRPNLVGGSLNHLHRFWSDARRQEHSVFPIKWFQLESIRSKIAESYEQGPLTLELVHTGETMGLGQQMLVAWLATRLPGGEYTDESWSREDCQVTWRTGNDNHFVLNGQVAEATFLPMSVHRAVKFALDRPQREQLFLDALSEIVTHQTQEGGPYF